jgi:hypothetical protein
VERRDNPAQLSASDAANHSCEPVAIPLKWIRNVYFTPVFKRLIWSTLSTGPIVRFILM